MEVMTEVKAEMETLIKWFNKQVNNNLKLHSTLLVTRRPDPEKKVREKAFTSPLKICRCGDFLELSIHAQKEISKMIPKTLKEYASRLNDLTMIEDHVNLMAMMLINSNENTALRRVYADP